MKPPKAPTAAASVGVERPNTIEPSTARMSTAKGKNDASRNLNTSRRSQLSSQEMTPAAATPMAKKIQNQPGIGSRSCDAGAASAALDVAVCGYAAGLLASAALASAAAAFASSCAAPGASVRPDATSSSLTSAAVSPPASTSPAVSVLTSGIVAA